MERRQQIMNKRTLWITRPAVLTAMLVVLQATTQATGNTVITGSVVNMLLIISVMACGILSGITVAVISPVMAKLIGIGPLWSLIPFIMAGNITLVLVWHHLGNWKWGHKYAANIVALIGAAFAKFAVLYAGIVLIAVPLLLRLPQPQASVITGMFSISQFITALLGGAAALLILPTVKIALAGRSAQR